MENYSNQNLLKTPKIQETNYQVLPCTPTKQNKYLEIKSEFNNYLQTFKENQIDLNESIPKPYSYTDLKLESKDLYSLLDNYTPINQFPENFKPRQAANMKVEEKVNKWLKDLPAYFIDDFNIAIECYPAVTNYSSSDPDLYPLELDQSEILEIQSRRVTRYATKIYLYENEPSFDKIINDSFDQDQLDVGNFDELNDDDLIFYGNLNNRN